MTAKEYLQEIKKIDKKISQKRIEYKNLYKMRNYTVGINYSRERVQTSSDGQGFTKISDKLLDLERKINTEIEKFCILKHERIRQIQQLSKVEYIDILFKRYVEYKDFETISYEMNYSYSRVCHIHSDALEAFEDIMSVTNCSKTFSLTDDNMIV